MILNPSEAKACLLTVARIFICSLTTICPLFAQQIILNELYNSSGMDEWVELLVVQDSLDLRGWDLRDFSSTGFPQNPLEFTSNALWSSVRSGTIIIVARPENTFPEDTDPSDHLLVIKSNNGLYFIGNVFFLAGSSDAVHVRTPSDIHVFGVSWGTANQNSLPSPRVHFSGSSTSNTGISFNGDSLSQLIATTHWTFNNSSPSLGLGNTAANAAWITRLRGQGQGDGSGSARIQPDTVNGGTLGSFQITYRRDSQYNINALRIFVPPAFIWSRSRTDISYTNMTAADTVIGDTISITNITFGADSTVITIANITSPDSTALYPFRVQSRQNTYADVAPVPRMVVFGVPIPISEVKVNDTNGVPLRLGQLVTIEGIVTVANEFGGPSSVQDNSGGIGIFGSVFSTAVNIGDEVKVSGTVTPFNGLSELTGPVLHAIVSTGNAVTPLLTTCSQLFNDGQGGIEQFEGLLVRVDLVTVVADTISGNPPSTWNQCGSPSGCNYRLIDATGHVDIRADNNVDFFPSPAPQGIFNVIGVLGQFKTATPFIGGYQLMPRTSSDLLTSGPIIATTPLETNIQRNSLTINWTTFNPGTTRLRYGLTANYELGVLSARGDTTSTTHAITLTGLTSATIYNVQAFSVSGQDTSRASNIVVSTASPSSTTGQINVYFNRSVDTSLSIGEPALGNQDLIARLLTRINNARRSIDVCLYSLGGNPGETLANALVSAKNSRGVRVRVVGEDTTMYDPARTLRFPWTIIAANQIPLISDRFDPINFGAGLMHNKFFVVDYRGGAPESVWVWTGSWNLTVQQTTTDYQNSIEMQDVALAGAYTLEFNEMWGSNTDVPSASNSRFGARKRDNTPHRFLIGGEPVECYFSPSDRTTSQINNTLRRAIADVAFAQLTITRRDIADELIARRNSGRPVRGVMDNNTDTGSQYQYLLSSGIDVHLEPSSVQLHHKYAIVDGTRGSPGPNWVVTGSHNWSNSAETSNNENTIVVQSSRVANLYLQEFAQRYYDAGGTDPIVVSVHESNGIPEAYSLSQNYPNPFNPRTTIGYELPVTTKVSLIVYNLLGQEIITLVDEAHKAGRYKIEFNPTDLASGVYFYRLTAGSFRQTRKMLFLK